MSMVEPGSIIPSGTGDEASPPATSTKQPWSTKKKAVVGLAAGAVAGFGFYLYKKKSNSSTATAPTSSNAGANNTSPELVLPTSNQAAQTGDQSSVLSALGSLSSQLGSLGSDINNPGTPLNTGGGGGTAGAGSGTTIINGVPVNEPVTSGIVYSATGAPEAIDSQGNVISTAQAQSFAQGVANANGTPGVTASFDTSTGTLTETNPLFITASNPTGTVSLEGAGSLI
jgi:hypothetical protein